MKQRTDGPSATPPNELWETDAKLTRAATSGDADAQRELLRRALPVSRRIARQLLRRSQDEDDAVQATLLEILRSAARFRGASSLTTWVTRIAIRTTLRLAEKQRALVSVDVLESVPAPTTSQGAMEELPRPVSHYLDSLPPPQRTAIVLRHCLDYTVDDIAHETETSPNTVKYRLKEALATMRRLIRQDLAIRRRGQ